MLKNARSIAVTKPFIKLGQAFSLLCLAVLLCLGLSAQDAHADTRKEQSTIGQAGSASTSFKLLPAALSAGKREAPALIAATKIPCEMINAYEVGRATIIVAGKEVLGTSYEIACKGGQGYVITRLKNGNIEPPFNCNQADAFHKVNKNISVCLLPENYPITAWLNTVAQSKNKDCVVDKAIWLGSLGDSKVSRYEIRCKGIGSGMYDIPEYNSTVTKLDYYNCIQVNNNPKLACTLTTREEAVAAFKPIIKAASATCVMSDIRWMGASTDNDFYEIGCSNEPGFVAMTSLAGVYTERVSCLKAVKLAGGCKFTTVTEVEIDQNKVYSDMLAKAGKPCNVQEFNIFGTQTATNRDFIEFKCPELAFGLLGFIPNEGSTSTYDLFDCFTAKGRQRQCGYVADSVLEAHVKKLAAASSDVRPDCEIKEIRWVGMSVNKGVLIEIACVNHRGYIASISETRKELTSALPCRIAKNAKETEKCTIALNGTYNPK